MSSKTKVSRNKEFIEIIGSNYVGPYEITRRACRGAVIKDGKILLSCETKTDVWMLPGGGLEEGETEKECVVRELIEETGHIVEPTKKVVEIVEYYGKERFISEYYCCDLKGITDTNPTEGEIEEGLEPRWISIEEALSIFSKYAKYEGVGTKDGLYLREYCALKKILDQ